MEETGQAELGGFGADQADSGSCGAGGFCARGDLCLFLDMIMKSLFFISNTLTLVILAIYAQEKREIMITMFNKLCPKKAPITIIIGN